MIVKLVNEATYSDKNIERATELLVSQIEKKLFTKLVRWHSTKSGNFRKKRGQDLYALKYELVDKYHYNNRVISFLWSGKKGGQLQSIEMYNNFGKSGSHRSSWNFPDEVIEDAWKYGMPKIIKKVVDYFSSYGDKEFRKSVDELEELQDEYVKLYLKFKKMGGEWTGHFYRLGSKQAIVTKVLGDMFIPVAKNRWGRTVSHLPKDKLSAEYHINTMKQIMGMKYNRNKTFAVMMGDEEWNPLNEYETADTPDAEYVDYNDPYNNPYADELRN